MRFLVLFACLWGAFAAHDLRGAQSVMKYQNWLRKDVVDNLDLKEFAGRWYQIKESPVSRFFTGGTDCNHQDYKMLENGSLAATFSGNKQGTSDLVQMSGYLYRPEDKADGSGSLKLRLFGTVIPLEAPYDVIALGEKGKDMGYKWAVVTDTLNTSLFVLVREHQQAKDEPFMKKLNEQLKEWGFNKPWNKPSNVHQGGTCKYAPKDDFQSMFQVGSLDGESNVAIPSEQWNQEATFFEF